MAAASAFRVLTHDSSGCFWTMGSITHPRQWHIPGQRNGSTLHVHTTLSPLKSPVGIQPSQEPVTGFGRQHLLPCAFRIFHFCDPRSFGATNPALTIQATIMHVVFGFEQHGNDFCF
jgi:hypothetical protein